MPKKSSVAPEVTQTRYATRSAGRLASQSSNNENNVDTTVGSPKSRATPPKNGPRAKRTSSALANTTEPQPDMISGSLTKELSMPTLTTAPTQLIDPNIQEKTIDPPTERPRKLAKRTSTRRASQLKNQVSPPEDTVSSQPPLVTQDSEDFLRDIISEPTPETSPTKMVSQETNPSISKPDSPLNTNISDSDRTATPKKLDDTLMDITPSNSELNSATQSTPPKASSLQSSVLTPPGSQSLDSSQSLKDSSSLSLLATKSSSTGTGRGRSLFDYSGSINLEAIKNASNLEDLERMTSSLPSTAGTSLASLKAALSHGPEEEEELDDEELDALFSSGPKSKKKHCNSRRTSNITQNTHAHHPIVAPEPASPLPPKTNPLRTSITTIELDDDFDVDELIATQVQAPVYVAPTTSRAKEYLSDTQLALNYSKSLINSAQHASAPPYYGLYAGAPRDNLKMVRLKLDIKGQISEYRVSTGSTFTQILKIFEPQLPTLLGNEEYFWKMDGYPLNMTKQIASLPIGDGDLIALAVRRDGTEVTDGLVEVDVSDLLTTSGSDPNKIMLVARFSDGSKEKWRMAKSDPLQKFAKAAADKLQVPIAKVKLMFDGDKVDLSSSPLDLDMEEEDMIDVEVKK